MLVRTEDLVDLGRKLVKAVDDLVPALCEGYAILRQLKSHHNKCDILRGIRLWGPALASDLDPKDNVGRVFTHLGGRDTDFRTSVDVDTAVSLSRDGTSDSVDDTDAESTALKAITHSEDCVGGFT